MLAFLFDGLMMGECVDTVGRSADQNFLGHAPAENQLASFDAQNKGAPGGLMLDLHLDTGQQPHGGKV
jgi:hypothetical protein